MDAQQLLQVKKTVKAVLGLPDAAQLLDFSVSTNMGTLSVQASVKLDIVAMDKEAPKAFKAHEDAKAKKKYQRSKRVKGLKKYEAVFGNKYTAQAKDFKEIRSVLGKWRKEGLLTPAEINEMGRFAGLFFVSMSEETRDEFLAFFNKIRDAVASGDRSPKDSTSVYEEAEPAMAGAEH